MRVLLVEDDKTSLMLLEHNLRKWDFEVVTATNGEEALAILEADDELFALVTDWQMPVVDGLELCRRVRKMSRDIYLYIIMVCGRDEQADLLLGMESGADVFLSKPFDPQELHAHLLVAERIVAMEHRLETRLDELATAHRALQTEIAAAGEIQRSLLPNRPPVIPGLRAGWFFESLGFTMGDMLNVVRLDEKHMGMYILDVSGHGTQAAMLSVSLSRVLSPSSQQGGILKKLIPEGKGYHIPSPTEVAQELNNRFPVMRQSGQFFTFLYGILNLDTLEFQYVRAGHTDLIHHSKGHISEHVTRPDVPVGIVADAKFTERSVSLERGDLIMFYTDGVEEARSTTDEEFGRPRLSEILCRKEQWSIEDALEAIRGEVVDFTLDADQGDDRSMVGFSVDL